MSVFESFPVRDGVGIFLQKHVKRLREACAATGFSVSRGALEGCALLLKDAPDGFGRIYVTAGDGGVTAPCDACRVLVLVEEREPTAERAYRRGYELGIATGGHAQAFAGLKTGNYWASLRALREGVAEGRDETLLFTPGGHLISACMANVFVAAEGRLKTPAPRTGARPGVVREWVMRQTPVTEALLSRAEVEAAEEIFLTSSWLGIMPAASIEGRALGSRKIGGSLIEAYRREVDEKPA